MAEAGSTVGSYRLERMLGVGATSEVWLGRHVVTRGLAAVKVYGFLPTEVIAREQRAVMRLSHPNVLPIFEAGRRHMAGAYVAGGSLRHRLHEPMAPAAALRIVLQVASALEHAHRCGVVHRDVKPSNILYGRGGTAYLADFGIATGARVQSGGAGTPAFAAPEQMTSGPITEAVDQYGLGRTLLALLLGDPTPAEGAERDVDSALSAPLRRALAVEPADRYPSMAEMARALREAAPQRFGRPRLAASLRAPSPFHWAASGTGPVDHGAGVSSLDYRLTDAARGSRTLSRAAGSLLSRSGLAELSWTAYARSDRLGSLDDPDAWARAAQVVVCLHGWGTDRACWEHLATRICADHADTVVVAPDIMGFGASPWAEGAPSLVQASPRSVLETVGSWLGLLGLTDLPRLVVGHSMAGLALLVGADPTEGRPLHRVALAPVVPYASESQRRAFRRFARALGIAHHVPGMVRAIARARTSTEAFATFTPEVRRRYIELLAGSPGRALARICRAVADESAPDRPPHAPRVIAIRGSRDPLTRGDDFQRGVEALGVPATSIRTILTGHHYPHLLDAEHPEHRRRNTSEILEALDDILQSARAHGARPTVLTGATATE